MSFSIGTSANVDMALDDMIKARRKSKTTSDTKKNNAAARATGKNKANRAANLAARRGLASTKKANAMEVEKQVQRQAGRAGAAGQGGRKNTAASKGGRGRGPKLSDVKSKIRAKGRTLAGIAKKKQQQQKQQQPPKSTPAAAVTAPSQQAIGAAAKAMKSAGFKPPKGMQMQISFVPKQQPQQQQQQKQGGGRGGGKGGRGGGGGGNGGSRGGGRGRGRGGRR